MLSILLVRVGILGTSACGLGLGTALEDFFSQKQSGEKSVTFLEPDKQGNVVTIETLATRETLE